LHFLWLQILMKDYLPLKQGICKVHQFQKH
jgi:hypothetical protein